MTSQINSSKIQKISIFCSQFKTKASQIEERPKFTTERYKNKDEFMLKEGYKKKRKSDFIASINNFIEFGITQKV